MLQSSLISALSFYLLLAQQAVEIRQEIVVLQERLVFVDKLILIVEERGKALHKEILAVPANMKVKDSELYRLEGYRNQRERLLVQREVLVGEILLRQERLEFLLLFLGMYNANSG